MVMTVKMWLTFLFIIFEPEPLLWCLWRIFRCTSGAVKLNL